MGAKHLGWSSREKAARMAEAVDYIGQFGGPVADKTGALLKKATYNDIHEVFTTLDEDQNGYLDVSEVERAAKKLGFPFRNKGALDKSFKEIDTNGNGRISSPNSTAKSPRRRRPSRRRRRSRKN